MYIAEMMRTVREPWNHNLHYHPLVLERVPDRCRDALDVGCGDGILVRRLAARAGHVTAIDRSAEMIVKAKERTAGLGNVTLIEGDFLAAQLPPESFDFIAAVAAIHHMPFEPAIEAMSALLRPGGVLAVVGLARNGAPGAWSASPRDYARIVPALIYSRFESSWHGTWDPGAPVREPEMTYAQITEAACRMLPDVELRRRLLFRYTLFWRKPPEA